jgi:hypothetical protein
MSFVLGMLLGILLLALVMFLIAKKIVVRWYEWLLGALGAVLALWAVNDYFASVAERNEYAGLMLLWMIGVPALIFIALAVGLPWWRLHPRKSKQAKPTKDKKPRFKQSDADLAS